MSTEMNKAPVVPITETVIFPGTTNRIFVNEVIGQNIRKLIAQNQTLAVGLTTKVYHAYDLLTEEDFYRTGVLLKLDNIQKSDNGFIIDIFTVGRAVVTSVSNGPDGLVCEYEQADLKDDLTATEEAEMIDYIKGMIRDIGKNFRSIDQFLKVLDNMTSLDELIGYTVPMMGATLEEKQALLDMDSKRERALAFMDAVIKQKDSVHLQLEISKKYGQEREKQYKEAMLREQMKNIQSELNELDEEGEEKSYLERVRESDMPDDVKKIGIREAKKLEQTNPQSSEYNVMVNYLDLLLELPWKSEIKDIDIAKAREILDSDHYGITDVKKRIIEHLAVMKLKQSRQGSILILAGPPGTGKTSLGKSIARALNREYVRVSLGGIHDESEIRGHRRTYVGAMPGRIIKGIKSAGTKNPVFILDEVDKLGASANGDPSAALLEVLDPEQNNTFADHYLEVPYDLSDVFFIGTANDLSTIPGPLLDRAEIIELSSYTENEKMHIAKEHLIRRVLDDHGLTPEQFSITDEALQKIITDYTAEAGVRGLTKALSKAARAATAQIVSGEKESVQINMEDIADYLGNKTRTHEKAGDRNEPGVVTGMAWTPVGGEILFTEAVFMPGNGKITTTGQLGDVMKESAEIAASLVRSRLGAAQTGFDFFKHDIHIHVPAGATPKDGPSAGVTLTTALASLILGIPVDAKLSMTGEISLSGKVLPVGGIKEKVMAAQRAGIKTILLPKENEKDIEDIPEEVRSQLTFKLMSTIDEVLEAALGVKVPQQRESFHLLLNQPKKDVEIPSMIL